jgi:hypothetical protein
MKKLMSLMLGLSFLVATVSVSYAQDTTKKESKKKSHKGGKKKQSTEKKGGSL